MDALRTPAGQLTRRVTGLLVHREGGGYAFPPHVEPRLAALVEEAARGPGAVRVVGALLKLARVLREQRASPSAAERLLAHVMAHPPARRIVLTRWAGGRRPATGSDLEPRRRSLAPHVSAARPEGALAASSFLQPGRDARARLLERRAKKEDRS